MTPARPALRSASAWRRLAVCAAVVAALALASAPAEASPKTLKRSVGNITMAPLDFLMAPVTSIWIVQRNIRTVEDTTAVRVFYVVPGVVWNTMVLMGAASIREFTGLMEFVPGLLLLPFDTDLDPLLDPVERGEALVNWDTPVLRVKFGIDYTTQPF